MRNRLDSNVYLEYNKINNIKRGGDAIGIGLLELNKEVTKKEKERQMGYDPGTIARFKGILLTQKAELMARLQRNGDPVFAEELKGTDERDRAQMIEQHIVTTVGNSEHLRDIESALQKCEDATYGLCSGCGTPISLARLEAIPIASRCKPCQAEHKPGDKPLMKTFGINPFLLIKRTGRRTI